MATAESLDPDWTLDCPEAVGWLFTSASSVAAAVVFPGPDVPLPAASLRNLRCGALLQIQQGSVWALSVLGQPWTATRLAAVAQALSAHTTQDPDELLLNRLADELGLPSLEIALPASQALTGSLSWDTRPLAVALTLARAFAAGPQADRAVTSADVDAVTACLCRRLEEGVAWFRRRLDAEALALAERFGEEAPRIYNYVGVREERCRRYRLQFAQVMPVLLKVVAAAPPASPEAAIRDAVDRGQSLADIVCDTYGVDPSVFRGLVGVDIEHCGPRWLALPHELFALVQTLRPDCRPGLDAARWEALNRWVAHAEAVTGRSLEKSLLLRMWVRDAVHAGKGLSAAAPAVQFDLQTLSVIEEFRSEVAAALGFPHSVSGRVVVLRGDDARRHAVDRWLLKRTRRQLAELAQPLARRRSRRVAARWRSHFVPARERPILAPAARCASLR